MADKRRILHEAEEQKKIWEKEKEEREFKDKLAELELIATQYGIAQGNILTEGEYFVTE